MYIFVDFVYRPKIGDLIAILPENYDTWVRGVVLYEPTPLRPLYSVITVDFGTVLHVSEVARLPEAFTHVPRTSVCCKVIRSVENEDEPVELYEASARFQIDLIEYRLSSESNLFNSAIEGLSIRSGQVYFLAMTEYVNKQHLITISIIWHCKEVY